MTRKYIYQIYKTEILRLCKVIFYWDYPTDLGEYLKTIEFFVMFKQGSLQDSLDSVKEIRYYAGSMDTLDEIKDVLDDLEKLLKNYNELPKENKYE